MQQREDLPGSRQAELGESTLCRSLRPSLLLPSLRDLWFYKWEQLSSLPGVRIEVERGRVDAEALTGRLRTIVEEVPQMGVTAIA